MFRKKPNVIKSGWAGR